MRKVNRLISKNVNFAQSLKFAKGGEVSKIIRLKVDEVRRGANDLYAGRLVQRAQRLKATYRLARTPWGEGPQQVRLELAEPRAL
jgi:hypothetical protein